MRSTLLVSTLFWLLSACNATELRRRLFSEDEISSLSYIAFGTSDTWGSGIEGEEDPSPFTYPSLLGSTVTKNLAIRASGPGYPALCLQSMMGDSQYQVVIIEYMLRADEGLDQLLLRLRNRFPHAILIFLDIWYPRMVRVADSGFRRDKESIGLEAYQKQMGYQNLHDHDFMDHLQKNPHKMYLNHRVDLQEIQRKVVQDVRGYVWQMPIPTQHDQLGAHVAQLAPLYSPDYKHLSKKGHEFVARGLKRLLKTIPASSTVPLVTAPWTHHDSCASWLLGGQVPHNHGSRVQLRMFDEHAKKYALDVDPQGGSLIIVNPFEESAYLYLSYMATGPPRKYPQTRITVGGESTILDPLVEGNVHIAVTKQVGTLQPGDNAVHVQAMEASEWPIRLVATSITQLELAQDIGLVNIQAMAEQHTTAVASN